MSDDRKPRRWAMPLAILAGLALGLGSAWWVMVKAGGRGIEVRGWSGSAATGSADADPWTRAQVAVRGLLALTKDQAIYLTARTDAAGRRLREECRYRVSGGPLPGRWWSVTVYAADNYLPRNHDDALSFDATEVTPDAQGRWTAQLGPSPEGGGAWASTRNAGTFDVTLRIYNPTPAAQADYRTIPVPRIDRLSCGARA